MPMGKPYGMKEMTAMAKQGEMNSIPDGQLYREPLEQELVGPTGGFESTTRIFSNF